MYSISEAFHLVKETALTTQGHTKSVLLQELISLKC